MNTCNILQKELININFPTIPKFDLLRYDVKDKKISSFITIQEGCDKFCTFCVVPYTRGPEFSRSIESILEEVKELIKRGTKEIILLGQNVNAWKVQNSNNSFFTLGHLIDEISKFDEILSIRYTTSHPLDMDLKLIATHKNNKKLMPYLHLPIQSGSDKILSKMNRKHTTYDYLNIIDKVRKYKPDIAISSDFIVGFPGETETEFNHLLDWLEEAQLDRVGCFKYENVQGAKSNGLQNHCSEKLKQDRWERFMKKAQSISEKKT